MKVFCNYCGKKLTRRQGIVQKNIHHFCDRSCYAKYQRNFWYYPGRNNKKDFKLQNKLKKMAIIYKEKGFNL